ncbi:hypothetical protein [Telmatospirillum sp. J64-1]|uniref:hypothetical protein n=1 Tax=Telmatospirillum sp. J64-1 TaxID=2502183 RepID=UPI00115E807C|nr:hypothetical protein [Telmatospirillum sp. J64-1]
MNEKMQDYQERARHYIDEARENMRNSDMMHGRAAETVRDNSIPLALLGVGAGWLIYSAMKRSGGSDESRIERGSTGAQGRYSQQSGYGAYGRRSTQYGGQGGGSDYGYSRPSASGFQDYAEPWDAPSSSGMSEHYSGSGERYGQGRESQHYGEEMGERGGQYGEKMRHHASHYADEARHYAEDMRGRVSHFGENARRRLSEWRGSMRGSSSNYMERSSQAFREYPLAMGALALLAGAAVAAALPRTYREDQILGRKRDEMMRNARGSSQDMVGRAKEAVAAAGETLTDEAEGLMKHAESAVEHAAEAAKDTMTEGKGTEAGKSGKKEGGNSSSGNRPH